MTFKRIGFLVLLIVMLVPVSAFADSYDYKDGLLDDPNIIDKIYIDDKAYDNDLTTDTVFFNATGETYKIVDFNQPVNIRGSYAKFGVYPGGRTFLFNYLNNKGSVESKTIYVSGYVNFKVDNVISVSILSNATTLRIYEIDFFGFYSNEPISDLKNINSAVTDSSALFTYNLPDDDNFSHVEIHANGKTYETASDSFTLNDLKPETSYDVTFYSVDKDGNKSDGVTVTVKTDKDPEKPKEIEVKNVKAKAEHNRVDLSWQLPEIDDFEYVTIYRKTLDNKTSSIFNIMTPKKAYASDGYDPIFETNGTYFNDLTVESATTYEYKLTSKIGDMETQGVTVKTTTKPPVIEGGKVEEQENGDYTLSWTEPTKGEVNIIVGGKVYATVPASDKSFTVPADDVKYNMFGDPDVALQAVAPNGTPGAIDKGGIGLDGSSLPFTVKNLIQSGNNLFLIVSSFLLLGLSFIIVPKIIKLIRESVGHATHKYSAGGRGLRPEREVRSGREPRLTERQRKGLMRHGF